ncbi:hypothetical protein [Tenacibaculum sp. nBUS_03]|uniref:hypothetical protein n=1 Tax=Tenacibaculum sp. nBUS_03 TaxID=3395320 RepID=UPI003EB6BD05
MTFKHLIFILFISNNVFSQFKDPEFFNVPSIYKLNGKIDSINTRIKDCSLSSYLNRCNDKTLWFDSEHRIIKEKYQDKYHRTITDFFSYDSNNNLIEKTSKTYDKVIGKILYKYNNTNLLIEIKSLKGSKIVFINKYEYRSKKRVKEIIFDKYEKPQNILSYTYNANGNLLEKVAEIPALKYGSAGFNKKKYFYNKSGFLIKLLEYESKNKLVSTTKYYYDQNNLLIKQEYYKEVNNHYNIKTEYKYKDDLLIEVINNKNQNEVSEITKYEYQFDEYKNLTNIRITMNNDIILDATYKLTYK